MTWEGGERVIKEGRIWSTHPACDQGGEYLEHSSGAHASAMLDERFGLPPH